MAGSVDLRVLNSAEPLGPLLGHGSQLTSAEDLAPFSFLTLSQQGPEPKPGEADAKPPLDFGGFCARSLEATQHIVPSYCVRPFRTIFKGTASADSPFPPGPLSSADTEEDQSGKRTQSFQRPLSYSLLTPSVLCLQISGHPK